MKNETLALLLSDTYKQTHDRMYPKGIKKLVSYWVPRKSMLTNMDHMVFFGLHIFIKEYLFDYFEENFFNLDISEVNEFYTHSMNTQLGPDGYDIEKIYNLWMLKYLPLKIRAIKEGTLVPMGVPCIEITNTKDGFAWLVQWVECILQVELWKICNHATMGYMYHQIAAKYYKKTVETDLMDVAIRNACADFGMRGMSCMEEARRASTAWMLSFNKTSTIPAISYIEYYYPADPSCMEMGLGIGAVSTEHSVMSANFAVDGDEVTFIRRLLTELYPHTSFSMVSDTYDYFNLLENIIPQVKEEILAHDGKMLLRPDSGDIVQISIRTVETLWDIFGGTVNAKGYKVLDPHIGVIYGDGCTLQNVESIWSLLEAKGFAANNIAFGVGAFCFSAFTDPVKGIIVNTRDTFGVAMKATFAVTEDDRPLMLYKDPKTDTEHLKKSHRGCCAVLRDDNGELYCKDGFTRYVTDAETELETVFVDGIIMKPSKYQDAINTLYPRGSE